jgi:tellurite resistance protein
MLVLTGSRVCYRTIARGTFHCERCGGDRPYQHRSGRRWLHVLGVPIAALGGTGEHLRCSVCHTCYRLELLAVPTVDQMELALLAGTEAAVVAMLGAGGAASQPARRRSIELVRAAGADGYDDERLAVALGERPDGKCAADNGPVIGLRPALETFSVQLEGHAKEWFLAKVVEVGLADGPLSAAEREVAGTVARYLGLSPARGRDVISLAEQAAQAG